MGLFRHQCRFEPRYDMGPARNTPPMEYADGEEAALIIDGYRQKTYVRDVCVRCGKTIERRVA